MFAYLAISRLKIDLFHIRDSIWSLIWPSTVRSCSFKVLQVLFLCFPSLDPSLTLLLSWTQLKWHSYSMMIAVQFLPFRAVLCPSFCFISPSTSLSKAQLDSSSSWRRCSCLCFNSYLLLRFHLSKLCWTRFLPSFSPVQLVSSEMKETNSVSLPPLY